jgi:hypothetical protein
LTVADTKAAARDYLGKTQDLIRQGKTREEAQAEAQDFINSKIQTGTPGKPYVAHWLEPNEPEVKAVLGKYDRSAKVYEAGTPDLAKALDKAGVSFSIHGDKGVIFSDLATADKGIALLTPGTVFTGPDGKQYKKK